MPVMAKETTVFETRFCIDIIPPQLLDWDTNRLACNPRCTYLDRCGSSPYIRRHSKARWHSHRDRRSCFTGTLLSPMMGNRLHISRTCMADSPLLCRLDL